MKTPFDLKHISVFLLMGLLFLLGCKPEEKSVEPTYYYLSYYDQALSIPANGWNSVSVDASCSTWVKFDESENDIASPNVTIRVGVNTESGDREGRVAITNASGKEFIVAKIIQHSTLSFTVEREFTPVNSKGETFTLPVNSAIPYIATASKSASWISISKDTSGNFNCTVSENTGNSYRSTTITFYDEHEIELGSHQVFQHMPGASVVKFTHSNQTMEVPTISGDSFDKAVIENEGRYQMYGSKPNILSYGKEEHETIITANKAESISFSSVRGITSIDLSEF